MLIATLYFAESKALNALLKSALRESFSFFVPLFTINPLSGKVVEIPEFLTVEFLSAIDLLSTILFVATTVINKKRKMSKALFFIGNPVYLPGEPIRMKGAQ
jgi:hypothetical protein